MVLDKARRIFFPINLFFIFIAEDGSEKWPSLKQHSTLQYLEKRSRVRKNRDQLQSSARRAASQDRSFVSLGNWRRKSEPSMAPPPPPQPQQYNAKTVPKKITNLKKAKESNATFYTDLSDSESCDNIANESNDSIDCGGGGGGKSEQMAPPVLEGVAKEKNNEQIAVNLNTLEKVVSDLLMQNKDFHKIFNKRYVAEFERIKTTPFQRFIGLSTLKKIFTQFYLRFQQKIIINWWTVKETKNNLFFHIFLLYFVITKFKLSFEYVKNCFLSLVFIYFFIFYYCSYLCWLLF